MDKLDTDSLNDLEVNPVPHDSGFYQDEQVHGGTILLIT